MTKTITQLEGRERRTWHLAFVETRLAWLRGYHRLGRIDAVEQPHLTRQDAVPSLGLTQEPV